MKTEMKVAYIGIRRRRYCQDEMTVSFDKPQSNEHWCSALISEVMVVVPVITDEDKDKLLAGAELESLYAAKEKLQTATFNQMQAINNRIGELQCIEFKAAPNMISADMLAAVKQELEYQETTLEDIIFKLSEDNLYLSADQLSILTKAEARGNGL